METGNLENIIENRKEKIIVKANESEKNDIEEVYRIIKSQEILTPLYEKFNGMSVALEPEKVKKVFEEIFDVILDIYRKNKGIPYQEFSDSIKKSLERISKPKITGYMPILFEKDVKDNIHNLKRRELAESYQQVQK